jgi:hemoglobin
MKEDIKDRTDLEVLLRSFYQRLLADKTISYLFTDVARMDLEAHIPVLTSFWDMVLFGSAGYSNNTMQLHKDLHRQSPLLPHHFDTWIHCFEQTVSEHFEGPVAELACQKARQIAAVMQLRLDQQGGLAPSR